MGSQSEICSLGRGIVRMADLLEKSPIGMNQRITLGSRWMLKNLRNLDLLEIWVRGYIMIVIDYSAGS